MPSLNLQAQATHLLTAASDPIRLEGAYGSYVQAVLDAPLWSEEHPDGVRVPWRRAREAATHPSLQATFASPGLYLFGSMAGMPLYLGMTTAPLWRRLRGRYVSGARSQCQLAADYEQELLACGMDGFPEEIRAWYRRGHGGGMVRLQGALTFAHHGIQGIWFTLLPISDRSSVRPLEKALIAVANNWNLSHRFPPLINKQDTRK